MAGDLDFEFRGFMLEVSKDMTENDFTQLKYLLKGYIQNAKCEEIKAVCSYFKELERMCLLSPTDFGVLKKALGVIGRQDLVEKIEEKEQYFANLSKAKKGDSLGPKEYDAVCDGITKAAETLEFLSRSGQNTPELQKKLKLTSLENEDAVQLEEITDALGVTPTAVTELEKEKKSKKEDHFPSEKEERPVQSELPDEMWTGGDQESSVKPSAQVDGSLETPLEETAQSNSGEGVKAAEDHLMAANTTEHDLLKENTILEADQKEPREDTLPDYNEQDESGSMTEATTDSTVSLPVANIPCYSSDYKLDDDLVTDGNEDDKEKKADSKKDDEKTTSKGAELKSQGPGARPKEPPLMTDKTAGPAKAAKQATEQADEGPEPNPHGTLFAESSTANLNTPHPEAPSTKEPTEGAYSGPSSPTGDISAGNESDELYTADEKESAEPVKPKSTLHGSGQAGASAAASKGSPGSHHPLGDFSSNPSCPNVSGATGFADHVPGQGASAASFKGYHPSPGVSSTKQYGFDGHAAPNHGIDELMGIAAALGINVQQPFDQLSVLNQLLALQQHVSEVQGFNPSGNPVAQPYYSTVPSHGHPATDSPLQANCYSKAGYSVMISGGHVCESTDEKGVVIMESGSQFCIAIANDNDYAAEVDITFGGMFLGVWVVEAKQSLSSPLIIEGASWARGRLRFFSASDVRKPQLSEDIYGENPALNGNIELEFKPEVKTMRLFAKHLREEKLVEIIIIDSKTTTVADLKRQIRKKWKADILYLMKGGEVLQEEKTISSYALNENEVIEVLNTKEELRIESVGRDPVTMMVDQRNVSVESVKDFIAKEIKINQDQQHLRFKEQDMEVDSETLREMLRKSKNVPVIKVYRDTRINVMVCLPSKGTEEKIEINWFATVDDLKEKLEEREICDTNATLKFNGTNEDISGHGSKKLFDLGFKNKSEITVVEEKRSTHRGFSSSAFSGSSRTRGFGGGFRGFDDYVSPAAGSRGFSGTRAFRNGPEDMALHDSSECFSEEGLAALCGNEESVYKHFKEDDRNSKQQFSKKMAVTLIIQLKAKSTGAAGGAAASVPSGDHHSGRPTGPVSTGTPPPVPE